MKKAILIGLLAVAALLLSSHAPAPQISNSPSIQPSSIQSQLDALKKRGFTYRFLDPTTVELTETWSGMKQVKSLKEPSEAEIRAWAAVRGVPILEIDPSTIDTTQFTGWYGYWTELPLSNFHLPLVVEDLDKNGRPEIYGMFKQFTSDHGTRAYEVDSTGSSTLLHDYVPRPGFAYQSLDADHDGLAEILFEFGGTVSSFEQSSISSIPTILSFQHNKHENGLDPGYTGIYLGYLDADSLVDFLYKGSEADSNDGRTAVYVAEFNPDSNNFVRVWSKEYMPESQGGVSGFSVDDFDQDGLTEFVVSNFSGQTFVTERRDNNSYGLCWTDSIPFVSVYYHGAGDVDKDGRAEFLVGASTFNGNWTVVFEADGNDTYSPILILHLLSGGAFDSPVYLTGDFNEDGRLEIAIFSGADLYVFAGNGDNTYKLWYYKREFGKKSVQLFDFNNDNRKDIVFSKSEINNQSQLRFFSTVYLASKLVGVETGDLLPMETPVKILPNYPNPFNPVTKIEYVLSRKEKVTMTVFDVLGLPVEVLVDETQVAGNHSIVWNPRGISSGVYFCRLHTSSYSVTRKLLLIR